MIVAVVLAAGRSRRIGRAKALLPAGSGSFLETVLDTVARSTLGDYRVVLGADAVRIRRAVALPDDRLVVNPERDAAMLSSIRCAIEALPRGTDGILVWPVDHPQVAVDTVDRIVDGLVAGRALIVLPTHGGRRGHPVGFSRRVFPELLSAPDTEGARAVVHARRDEVLEVPVSDAGVVRDIDTPEAYARVFGRPIPE